jgi:hypothetical protein
VGAAANFARQHIGKHHHDDDNDEKKE